MTAGILETMGKVAGIGGLALGVFLLVFKDFFKDFLREKIFSQMPPEYTYRIMRQFIWATWSVTILGLLLWYLGATGVQFTFGPGSSIINFGRM